MPDSSALFSRTRLSCLSAAQGLRGGGHVWVKICSEDWAWENNQLQLLLSLSFTALQRRCTLLPSTIQSWISLYKELWGSHTWDAVESHPLSQTDGSWGWSLAQLICKENDAATGNRPCPPIWQMTVAENSPWGQHTLQTGPAGVQISAFSLHTEQIWALSRWTSFSSLRSPPCSLEMFIPFGWHTAHCTSNMNLVVALNAK